jgi:hypothetical protein
MSFNTWITVVLTGGIMLCMLAVYLAVASAEASRRTGGPVRKGSVGSRR